MGTTRIATVIFDLGRTLIPFSFAALEPRLASCQDRARALFEPFERGQLSPDDFRIQMCALTGMAGAELDPWWNAIFGPNWLIPPAWLGQLRRQRRLGLLSNTNALHWAYLERTYPELREFDFHILSFAVGAVKPNNEIFSAAEAAAGCPPQQIFYSDDVPAFVHAAERRGWQARRFDGAESLADELAAADPELAHLAAELRTAASRLKDKPSAPASASTTMRSGPPSPT